MNFALRRRRVLDALGADAALVLAAAPELRAGRDGELRYAVDPDLYYLTGFTEPECVLVLAPGGEAAGCTLFVRPRDAARELWTGARLGVEAAAERLGADRAFPIGELAERLPALLRGVDTLHARLPSGSAALDALVPELIRDGRRQRARDGAGITTLREPALILDDLRLIKDAAEIDALRAAARLTVAAFEDALRLVRPGHGEWQVEAALEAGFRGRGALGPAFPSIVAGGANATVLHYVANAAPLRAGTLLLLDAGARDASLYCADVSRTVPVSGRCDDAQRRLHDAVLAARAAAIDAVRPGTTIAAVHAAAVAVLADALRGEGLIGDGDDCGAFFPHRVSHWLGLDVHDVGDYVRHGEPRVLEPGMVLTVEPALYITADSGAPAALHGTGIRIEDDVLVTADGAEVLTAALPADAAALAALMS